MSERKIPPFVETKEQAEKLAAVLEKNKGKKDALINALHQAQVIYGYLPLEVQKRVADAVGVSLTEVYGVITFYTQFSLTPKGKYQISVCMGTACYVKGAGNILDKLKQILKIETGECTDDGKFSIDATRCIGACGLAPVLTVNEDVYGKIGVDDVVGIVEKY